MNFRPSPLAVRCRRLAVALVATLAFHVIAVPAGAAPPEDPNTKPAPPAIADALQDTLPPVPESERSRPSVASVFQQFAERELPADEMNRLRGGFLLTASVAMDMRIEFSTLVNGEFVPITIDPSIMTAPGIVTRLQDGVATVFGTNDFRGVVGLVQNNLNFQDLKTTITANFNLTGSMSAIRSGLLRNQMNFTNTALGL